MPMSDVAIAPNTPPPAPASTPAPAHEVPLDPNPVGTPAPVGSQAPPKPEGERVERKPESRREVIQRAVEKAEASRPKPEARKAKMGDNNPPEEIDREKPSIDLKRPPSDQPKAAGEQRDRGEHGHFAPRQQEGREPPVADRGVAPQPGRQRAQLPEGTPFRDPPQRMSEQAKADWHATPESVRGDLHRAVQEFQRAYGQYRQDHQVMNTIRNYQQMAAQHGTTLERALSNYTQMEQKLRQDPFGGFDIITHNLNLRAEDGTKLTFADIAYGYLNQTPEQHKLLQSQNTLMAQSHQMRAMQEHQQALAQELKRMQYQQQFTQTRAQLDRYADAKPRFDELSDLIEREIKLGFTLDQAYARANLLRPSTHAAQTRSTTAQTRTSGKSISGAPAGPSNGTGRRPDKPVGRRDAIASAMKRVNGSL